MNTRFPSLPPDLAARTFCARNGELGLHLTDVQAYVDLCHAHGIRILGWEAWVINHSGTGNFSPGDWTGLIPQLDGSFAVVDGDGGGDDVKEQCASFRPEAEVPTLWLPHIRINITTDAK